MNKNHTKRPAGSTPASTNSNELVIISQQQVLNKNFIVYGTFENPLFLAKDVAEWIEHSNVTEMVRYVDSDEKLNSKILNAGQYRDQLFLTEDGLYEVLMQSRKPIAKSFKKEVKKILKALRVKGYLPPAASKSLALLPDDVPITAFPLVLDLPIEEMFEYFGTKHIGTHNRFIRIFQDLCYLIKDKDEIIERAIVYKEVTFITKFTFSKNEE